MEGETTPMGQSDSMDLFAATWLQQWSEGGGSVAIDRDGRAFASMLEYHDSPAYVAPNPALPDAVQEYDQTFRDGHYCGRMRAMLKLLEAMPGGWDAVKSHMIRHGMVQFVGARRDRAPRATV